MAVYHPTVSVLVPTFNRSSYLKVAVESILAQSFTDFEIIITDNCSVDDTEQIINKFDDSRIVYVRNPVNVGPANNHNRALRLARGKYIYFFSDDDVMLPDNLAVKVHVLEENPSIGLVHSNIKIIDEHGLITSEHHWASYWSNYNERLGAIWRVVNATHTMVSSVAFDLLYYHWNFISMPTVMVRRSLIDDNRLELNNQLRLLYDWDLWVKLAMFTNFYYVPQPLVLYRIHSSNDLKGVTAATYFREIFVSKIGLLNLFQKFDLHGDDYISEVKRIVQSQLIEAGEIITSSQRVRWHAKEMFLKIIPASLIPSVKLLLKKYT